MLQQGRVAELKQVFWKAEPFSRVDVLHLEQLWDDFESEDRNVKIPFPPAWSHLNEMMSGGMEKGEITVIGALTSIGKSTIVNNIVYHLIENTGFKVGAMYLESTKREVVRDLLSLDIGVNLRVKDRDEIDLNALKKRFFEGLAKKDQFVYVDHQGSISTAEIFDKLNYLAKAEGCDVIIIDPIQAGVNSSDNGAIIEFMDTLLKFAKETDTCVIAVSHMRKPSDDDPHSVSEYQLMGSASINQIAFNTILVSRDKLNDDPKKRSATKLQLVKCRRTGNTGEAGWLRYDHETTHMFATSNPYIETSVATEDEQKSMSQVEKPKREVDF
jgi:twinkle protein